MRKANARRVILQRTNGATFAFPPRLVEGLHNAKAEQIVEVKVSSASFGLRWEAHDLDYPVPGLVGGVFGTAQWLASKAGRATSEAKAAAARANGAKGGRREK